MTRIAVLGYHKVGPPPPTGWETWFYVPEATFAEQLAALRSGGWQPVDLATFLRGLTEPEGLPERSALITFDDGYGSVLDVALPWLERFGYPAVLFMPTDFVGRTNLFDLEGEPEEQLCDWDDLRELVRRGVAVQSHGVSHRAFSELSPAERGSELERSKAALEDGLGQPVELFAYPYGDDAGAPPDLREAFARAGYRAACRYGGGPFSVPASDPYRLERVAMGPDSDVAAALELGRSTVDS
jgi:peptidoglycan/xylan/chitin deacetylase (PgdA/CDA1 family)